MLWIGLVGFFFQEEDGIRDLVRSRGLEMCIRDSLRLDGGREPPQSEQEYQQDCKEFPYGFRRHRRSSIKGERASRHARMGPVKGVDSPVEKTGTLG